MSTPLNLILDRLTEKKCSPRESGSGWSARCPAHADKNPSLSVATGEDGCALIKCHAGCEVAQVLDALGLSSADLFAKQDSSG